MFTIECAKMGCRNRFKPRSSRHSLCSAHRNRKVPKLRQKIKCKNCHKEMTRRTYRHMFCSKDCRLNHGRKMRMMGGARPRTSKRLRKENE